MHLGRALGEETHLGYGLRPLPGAASSLARRVLTLAWVRFLLNKPRAISCCLDMDSALKGRSLSSPTNRSTIRVGGMCLATAALAVACTSSSPRPSDEPTDGQPFPLSLLIEKTKSVSWANDP